MSKKSILVQAQVSGPCLSRIDGEVVDKHVLGTTGELYHGREVVIFKSMPGMFGAREGGREMTQRLTLHKGLLNQCALVEPPSPSWAVWDAACELRDGFDRQEVIDEAVRVVGEEKRQSCRFAWDILRQHHRHERKRDAGMGVIFESADNGKTIARARTPEETKQYFEWMLERKGCKVVRKAVERVEAAV